MRANGLRAGSGHPISWDSPNRFDGSASDVPLPAPEPVPPASTRADSPPKRRRRARYRYRSRHLPDRRRPHRRARRAATAPTRPALVGGVTDVSATGAIHTIAGTPATGAIRTLGPNPATAPIVLHPGDSISNGAPHRLHRAARRADGSRPVHRRSVPPGVPGARGGLPDDRDHDPAHADRNDARVRSRPADRRAR